MIILEILLVFLGVVQAGLADNASKYNFEVILYDQKDYTFHFLWNITKNYNNTNKDYLDGMMLFQSNTVENITNNYVSIGFGKGMLDSEFIFAKSQYNSSTNKMDYRIAERISIGKYTLGIDAPFHLIDKKAETNSSMTAVVFKRPLDPFNGVNRVLQENMAISLVWAFEVNPIRSVTLHKLNHRGGFDIMLNSGSALAAKTGSFTLKIIHGVGLMVVWLVIFPFGAFYARYARSIQGWLVVKVSAQVTGSILNLAFLFTGYSSTVIHLNNPHFWIGLVILGITLMHMTLGCINLLALSNESANRWRSITRFVHRYAGFGVMILSIIQIGSIIG
ncbi:hypothetical protein HDV02_003747 [Globomyces sp. JEL0801]|nr:hypothetical protein HDV02_003747 [Globomyces sp. JEL0801]